MSPPTPTVGSWAGSPSRWPTAFVGVRRRAARATGARRRVRPGRPDRAAGRAGRGRPGEGRRPVAPVRRGHGQRFPGLDVRTGTAESCRAATTQFDAALAQLVVHFMTDPVAGLREMARVTRPGGRSPPASGTTPAGRARSSPFWLGVREVDPARRREPGGRLPRGPPGRAVRRGRAGGGRADDAQRHGVPIRDLRGVVGAVHLRRRSRRWLPGGAASRAARPGAGRVRVLPARTHRSMITASAWTVRGRV